MLNKIKVFQNQILSVLSSIVSNLVNVVIVFLLMTKLGKENYGSYSFLYVTISAIGSTIGLSSGVIATNFVAQSFRSYKNEIFNLFVFSILLVVTSIGIVYILFLMDVLPFFSGTFQLTFILTSLCILFLMIDSFLKSILIGMQKMKPFALSVSIGAILNLLLIIFFLNQLKENEVLIAYAISLLIMILIDMYFLPFNKKTYFGVHYFKMGLFKINYNVIINILSSVLFPCVLWFLYFFMKKYGSSVDLAEFNLGYQIFLITGFLPIMANRVLVPILVKSEKLESRQKIVKSSILLNTLMSVSVTIFLFFFLNPLLNYFHINGYFSPLVSIFMSMAAVFSTVSSSIGQYIFAENRFKDGLYLNSISMIFMLCISFFLIKNYFAIGASLSFCLAYLLHMIISLNFFKNKI